MYTLCSHCDTPYEVSPEALARGRGQLHCTACGHSFDALERLSRTLPPGAEQARVAIPAHTGPHSGSSAQDEDLAQGSLPLEPAEAPPAHPAAADPEPALSAPAADFTRSIEAAGTIVRSPEPALLPEAEAEAEVEAETEATPDPGTEDAQTAPTATMPAATPAPAAAQPQTTAPSPAAPAAPAASIPPVFQWLEQAAATAPPTPTPAVEIRTDALVEVLTAHADFIEPPADDADADADAGVDAGPDAHRHDPADASDIVASQHPPEPDTVADIDPHAFDIPSEGFEPTHGIATHAPVAEDRDGEAAITLEDPAQHPASSSTSETQDETALGTAIGPQDPAAASDIAGPEPAPLFLAAASTETDHADPFHPVLDAPTPSFIPANTPTLPSEPAQRRWPAWLAVAALLLSLGLLSLIAERDTLAADARWRPWLERTCETLPCTLSPWREPAAMQLMTRDVRPHPSVPGALLISASFRNQAQWAQPWPQLDLTLSDLNGQPIAQRQFQPDQYLGIGARESLIQPDQTASVTLEVRDPGKQAVAFEFDFR